MSQLNADQLLNFTQFALDHMTESALWIAADGHLVYVNESACARLDYARDELLSMCIWEIEPDLGVAQWAVRWEELKRKGRLTFESRHRNKSGSLIPVEIEIDYVTHGDLAYACGIARDISERKRIASALRQSEERFRSIFASAAIGMALLDVDGMRVQLVNPALERFIGMSGEELKRRGVENVTHPDDWLKDANLWDELCAGQRDSYTIDMRYVRGDGETAWGRLTLSSACNDAGVVTGVIAMVEDVTERRRAAEELAKARDAAEAANRAKSEFLANMSHELRTPLNAVLGFSELMAQDTNLTDEQKENLTLINRSGEHLLGLINDVLDLAKIEAGRITLQADDFDLMMLVEELTQLFHLRAAAKGLALDVTVDPNVPEFVHADEGKLRQMLINLLGNAVKFTDKGKVNLTVTGMAPAGTRRRWRLRFVVRDTGAGIARDDLSAIFEPFIQAARGKAAREGTGLGLPISRNFARLMGGDLTVASTGIAGEGSEFTLEIPVDRVDSMNGEIVEMRQLVRLAPDQPHFRLLVVEDDDASRKLLADLLARLGFDVRTAGNGREAIERWLEWQPHLIWMDMRMPVLDGRAATRHIKSTRKGQATVVVAVSAGVIGAEREAVLADGCDDFVAKPFREQDIVECLARHLNARFVAADATAGVAAHEFSS